jgi:hypothetical protein
MNLPPQMTLAMGKSQITSHVTRGGRLHVMTRNQEGLNLYDVNLADGSIRNPDGEVLLDMGNAAHAFPGFTTWLDDERVQLLISQGVFSRDYSLYDVNYAGR